jgi:CrcB protein
MSGLPWTVAISASLVALGAAAGTPARFFVSGVIARRFGETFPWGTLVVNVSGCLLMGMLGAFARARGFSLDSELWLLAATGFLGSYTTVSSFALQTRALLRDGERRQSLGYVVLSLVLCLVAAAAGLAVGLHAFAAGGTR